MKKECEIVQDLIFGYCDETLNPASKELVEKHLIKCDECKRVYEEIKKDKTVDDDKEDKIEIDYLKRVNKKLKRKKIIIAIASIFIVLLVILHIIAFISYYHYHTTIEIFMNENMSEEEIENIRKQIENQSEDVEITYVSPEEQLEKMKQRFKENQDLLDGYNEENNIFPPSFIIKTKTIKDMEKIEKNLEGVNGIKKISSTSSNLYESLIINIYTMLHNDNF